jgi:hypothetical protein
MVDAISLAMVSGTILTEGIKFLYSQASKILERRAARNDAAQKEQANLAKAEPANVQLPDSFQGQLSQPEIDFDEVERLHLPLLELRGKLANYGDGYLTVDRKNPELLLDIEKLRSILESIYQQRITFKDEAREPSGTKITTRMKLNRVQGRATGTRIAELENGIVETDLEIRGDVGETGEVIGTDIGKVKSGGEVS